MITFREYHEQQLIQEDWDSFKDKVKVAGLVAAMTFFGYKMGSVDYMRDLAAKLVQDEPSLEQPLEDELAQLPQPDVGPPPAIPGDQEAPDEIGNLLPETVYGWIFNNETLDRDGDGDRDADLVAYDDGAGNMTIGVGHHLQDTPEDRVQLANVAPDTDYDQLLASQARLTEEQAMQLFRNDVDHDILPDVERIVTNFDTLSDEEQAAVVDARFRGDLGPDTATLISRSAPGHEIATEYLNHDGYRNAAARGLPGIRTRMDANAEIFRNMNRPNNNR